MADEIESGGDTAVADAAAAVFGDEPVQTPESQPTEQPEQTQQAPATPARWEDTPLPEGHPGAGKYRTLGEAWRGYQSSSDEARRIQAESAQMRKLAVGLGQQLQKLRTQPAEAAPVPGAAKPYFGFPSREEFNRQMQVNPDATMKQLLLHQMRDPEFRKTLIDPAIQEHLEPLQQERMRALRVSQFEQAVQKYPGLKEGTPENDATAAWAEANPDLMKAFQTMPNVNVAEVAYKLATYDLLMAERQKVQTDEASRRGRAATVRPGTGGKSVPKNGTPEEIARAIAAETGLGEDEVRAMADFLEG